MKRSLHMAGLAVLGVSIVGFATYLFGQPPANKTPSLPSAPTLTVPGSAPGTVPSPISLPGTPPLPPPTQPKLTVPGLEETSKSGVTLPSVSAPGRNSPPASLSLPTMPEAPVQGVPSLVVPGVNDSSKTSPVKLPVVTAPGAPRDPKAADPKHEHKHSINATEDNPTGRQEPAVSLEWIGPAAAKIGHPADYSIMVRNVCNIPVQQVQVRVRLAQGVQVVNTEPKAAQEEGVLVWDVNTLLPKQERNLQVKMVSNQKGDINCQAWVTFTGASAMKIRVREPKLLIKTTAPEKALVGDACPFVLTISNPGDHPAELVKIHASLSDGLEGARGNKVVYEIGNLAAGETRTVQVICAAKAGGSQFCSAYVEADGGLKATDKAEVNVITPSLKIDVAGPKLRYLDRKAIYTIKVTNPGDAPATNVQITDTIPPGFKFLNADNGGRHDFSTRTVSWFLGEVAPGQNREVKLELQAINPGLHQHKVLAVASRGLRTEDSFETRVEGLSAITVEMIDLEDPVEVGAETTYEMRITNTGSKTETDVRLACVVPDKMQFKSASGPTSHVLNGSEIVFQPIPKLAPRADAIYRVTVKTTAPGVVNFKSRLTSTILQEPVTKEEPTRIYADQQ